MIIPKLNDANDIIFKGEHINSLYLGSKKLWERNETIPTFELNPVVIESDGMLRLNYFKYQSDIAAGITTYTMTGNSTCIFKASPGIKLSDIDISYLGGTDGAQNKVLIQRIDDFALLFCKGNASSHGTWPGGSTGSNYNEYTDLIYKNQTLHLRFKGVTDEDNAVFSNGMYVSKVIKIPACGRSGT